MRRFDEDATLDRLAERGELTRELIAKLARAIHSDAPARADPRAAAPAIAVARDLSRAERAAFAARPDLFPPDARATLDARARAALDGAAAAARSSAASAAIVRRCHGDLHLRNIAVIDGEPTPFDAIEFDESIATGDVLYDLAFAVMDLWERDLRAARQSRCSTAISPRARRRIIPASPPCRSS